MDTPKNKPKGLLEALMPVSKMDKVGGFPADMTAFWRPQFVSSSFFTSDHQDRKASMLSHLAVGLRSEVRARNLQSVVQTDGGFIMQILYGLCQLIEDPQLAQALH